MHAGAAEVQEERAPRALLALDTNWCALCASISRARCFVASSSNDDRSGCFFRFGFRFRSVFAFIFPSDSRAPRGPPDAA